MDIFTEESFLNEFCCHEALEQTKKAGVYRSQHYDVLFEGMHCEIQVRTLAEEAYGEFDHLTRYPYRNNNKFLIRYNHIVSKAVSELDDLISTCCKLPGEELDRLGEMCDEDIYKDWKSYVGNQEDNDSSYDSEATVGTVVKNCIYTRKG